MESSQHVSALGKPGGLLSVGHEQETIVAKREYKRKCSSSKKLSRNEATGSSIDEVVAPRTEIMFDVQEAPVASSEEVRPFEDQEWEILFNFQLRYRAENGMSVRKFLDLLGVSQPKSLEGYIWNSQTQTPSHQAGTKGFVFRQQLREFMEAHMGLS